MSEQAVVDNLDFARRGAVLQGRVAVASLGRVLDLLFSEQGELEYTLAGRLGAKGEPLLECRVKGEMVLRCQRCLEALPHVVDIASVLKVVQGATEFDSLGDELDGVDSIPASAAMNVLTLIEEEILLGLPIAPLHDPGSCRGQGVVKTAHEEKTNPFGALEALKGKL